MSINQYKATMRYLANRERLSRLQLIPEHLIDEPFLSERKALTLKVGDGRYVKHIGGQLPDYGAIMELSVIGRDRLAQY